MRPTRPDDLARGFTLLEILVASLILSIALVAIQASILGLQDGMIRSADATLAATLASGKMAEIETAGAANLREKEGDLAPDAPDWTFTAETETTGFGALTLVTVSVFPTGALAPAFTLEKLVYAR